MKNVAIAGAGPAGLAAAIFAAEVGASVAVFERNDAPGRKLLVTGGGHCNAANMRPEAEWPALFGKRGRFIVPALRFMPRERVESWFASMGQELVCTDGFHLFPRSNSARAVRDALVARAAGVGVRFYHNCAIDALRIADAAVRGVIAGGEEHLCDVVVLATGGRSYPATGSIGDGYRLAAAAGHAVTATVPGLVGLRAANLSADLAGLVFPSARVSFKTRGKRAVVGDGELLLTHNGVSGPAVLDLSAAIAEALAREDGVALHIAWVAAMGSAEWLDALATWRRARGGVRLAALLREYVPQRFARWILARADIDPEAVAANIAAAARDRLVAALSAYPAAIVSTEGWERAMITRGGVDVREVDADDMTSRLVAGLRFAGEVLDIDGPCGGYNLHWAFASGALAGAGGM